MKKRHLIISLVIIIATLYYTFRNISIVEIQHTLESVHYIYLFYGSLIIFSSLILRAYRWKYLILSVKDVKINNLFPPIFIGFMGNFLPARAGEFIRAYLLGKKEDIKFSTAFATIFIERLFDLVAVLFMLAWVLLFRADIFNNISGKDSEYIINMTKKFGLISIVMCLIIVLFSFLLIYKRQWINFLIDTITYPLPDKYKNMLCMLIESFAGGIGVLKDFKSLIISVAATGVIWGCIIMSNYPFFFAFNIEGQLPFFSLVLLTLNISIFILLLPTPAYIGSYQVACVVALHTIYNINEPTAASFGIITWLINTGVVFVSGLFYLVKENISFRELTVIRSSSEEEEAG